ncbi:hypothetical protein FPOA_14005 [Fusarium poae]|uniref:Metallo-beta-lactamase domain-containing protein n=1 Tax=Fusarium poae TaxID=36050 RepID=A0A1B8A3C4_FUSPO|nr:hypothetical protein FPOA_14005 [Fusarium poae]
MWFDLGISQDLTVYPPQVQRVQHKIFNPEVGNKSPADDVRSLGDDPDDLKYIIFSHAHWDHVFPAASFHPNAKYLSGKGCFEYATPCWPTEIDGGFDGRVWDPKISDLPIEEFSGPTEAPAKWRQLGPFKKAYDFFGDGSFWIIDAPGHCLGNLAALARFKNKFGQAKWAFLGGDCFHCPHFVQHPEAPFGKGSPLTLTGSLHENEEEAREIIKQTAELKKGEGNDVLVWIAHCDTLEGSWQLS